MQLEVTLKLGHYLPCELVEVRAGNTQKHVGLLDLKVVKQRAFECGVVCCPRIHQRIVYIPTLRLGRLDGSDHRSHLDKVRACPTNNANIHVLSLLFL
jgi:hypothetical protein